MGILLLLSQSLEGTLVGSESSSEGAGLLGPQVKRHVPEVNH